MPSINTTQLLQMALAAHGHGQLADAEKMYRQVIAADARQADALHLLGVLLHQTRRSHDGIASIQQAIALNGKAPMYWANLAIIFHATGQVAETAEALRNVCLLDYKNIDVRLSLAALLPLSFALHALHYVTEDPAELYQEHRRWAELIESRVTQCAVERDRNPKRRLRVGYISPDFRQHSVSFFIEPVLAGHNRRAFEVYCYANLPRADEVTRRLRSEADHWRSTHGMSDEEFVALVDRDKIDILIDLAVHTQANRLAAMACKPAPLQGTWLGYASTTGLKAIDFRITDAWIDPPGRNDAYHSEKLVRLPQTQWAYRPPAGVPDVTPLPALNNGFITFGLATNLAKINPASIAMWCNVMRELPGCKLIIKGSGTENTGTRDYFLRQFEQAGIGRERIGWEPEVLLREYFDFFSRIDLIMDTFPFAGGTTSCHALYMGVPVVTLRGETSVSRVGSSLLHNLDLGELVADTPEAFVAISKTLAADVDRLSGLRADLRSRMRRSPIMEESAFINNLESAYRALWEEWCAAG
ncbi:MAG TPA: hypothetical protein VGG19_01835 [Tepidisphaeraceae bacterium]|jgi:predicted O-linked N-acetylglucosamine transferase (SPINDLY family)